jgi:hypothetical protein
MLLCFELGFLSASLENLRSFCDNKGNCAEFYEVLATIEEILLDA